MKFFESCVLHWLQSVCWTLGQCFEAGVSLCFLSCLNISTCFQRCLNHCSDHDYWHLNSLQKASLVFREAPTDISASSGLCVIQQTNTMTKRLPTGDTQMQLSNIASRCRPSDCSWRFWAVHRFQATSLVCGSVIHKALTSLPLDKWPIFLQRAKCTITWPFPGCMLVPVPQTTKAVTASCVSISCRVITRHFEASTRKDTYSYFCSDVPYADFECLVW